MQLGVGVGVPSDLKEGVEDVVQQLLKVLNDALLLVHIVQPWQLHPSASTCSMSDCCVQYQAPRISQVNCLHNGNDG